AASNIDLPWLHHTQSKAEAVPVRRPVADLRLPVSVQVTGTDAAQRRGVAGQEASASTNAQQGHVGQDGVGCEDAQILTNLDATPALVAEGQERLTILLISATTLDQRIVGRRARLNADGERSEEHTSELQSRENLVCRLLLEKKKTYK